MIVETKIEVIRKPDSDLYEIYLFQYRLNKVSYGTVNNGMIEMHDVIDGGKVEPLMQLTGWFWKDFVRAISTDLPNISKDEIDAELKATKFHLEDMRKLVFKGKL